MRKLLRLLPAVVVPLALGAGGCSAYRPPQIKVGVAEVTQRSDEAVRLDIALDLHNPNGEPMPLRRFEYTVSVDGVTAYRGRWAAGATLRSTGDAQLVIPAVVRHDVAGWGDGLPEQVAWSVTGRLLYVTPGEIAEILLDTGVRKPRVKFSGRGSTALR